MKFKSIQYSESYEYQEYGMKRWKKMGIEAELDEGESPIEAHRTLRQCVDEIKAETLTHLEEFRGTTLRDIKEEKPKDALGGFVEAITTCTTIKALETFKKLVEMQNVPELYEAYSETKKRLDNEQH